MSEHKLALDARRLADGEVLDRLADLVGRPLPTSEHRGIEPVGLTVGVAGLVDRERDVLTLGPNLGLARRAGRSELRARLGDAFPVTIENEGNLAALAEATPGRPGPSGHPGDLRRGRRRRRHRRRAAGCCAAARGTPASSVT